MVREMLDLLRRNYWLGESSTLAYYERLMMLYEIWEMRSEKRPDQEIIAAVIYEDQLLDEFEKDLESHCSALMQNLSERLPAVLTVTPSDSAGQQAEHLEGPQ